MSRAEPEIDAVVVTFNRSDKLKKCLEKIKNQSHRVRRIYVVDNCSTDGTRRWLALQAEKNSKICPVLLEENAGGAGGFNAGLRKAYEGGADWVWLMDDDVLPKRDCLKALVCSPFLKQHTKESRTIGFLSSRVEWTDGEICLMNIPVGRWPWNGSFHEMPSSLPVISNSFVSCLVSREGIARVGLPVKEFFIWADDTEYTRRLSYHFECFYIDASAVVHDTPSNALPRYEDITNDTLWKYLCDIRNVASFEARVGRKLDKLFALEYVLRSVRNAYRGTRSKRIAFRLLVAGIKGIFWNYKKLIEYV